MMHSSAGLKIDALPWDSEFLGVRVGRTDVVHEGEIDDLDKLQQPTSSFDLIYVFADDAVANHADIMQRIPHAKHVDTYTTHCLTLADKPFPVVNGIEAVTTLSQDLWASTIAMGNRSRFAIDEKLGVHVGERLYKTWLQNSLNHSFADMVYSAKDELGEDMGYLTLQKREGYLSLVLISVLERYKRRGIATRLFEQAAWYAQQHGLLIIKGVTQHGNIAIERVLAKCGYVPQQTINVYHVWN
jgi:dTDP-4-amino-4,6-dideoxy-D-galactose acyltransferase